MLRQPPQAKTDKLNAMLDDAQAAINTSAQKIFDLSGELSKGFEEQEPDSGPHEERTLQP